MENIKPRQLELLKLLITSPNPVSTEMLMMKFNRSERTIHYDVIELRKFVKSLNISIRIKSKQGYYIPAVEKQICIELIKKHENKKQQFNYRNNNELLNEILLYFALSNEEIKTDICCEKLAISVSTYSRVVNKTNALNEKIQIIKGKNGYKLDGNEYEIRLAVSSILSSYLERESTIEEGYDHLPIIVKQKISKDELITNGEIIKEINGKYNVWISNVGYITLLSYCMFQKRRRNKQPDVCTITENEEDMNYAREILERINNQKEDLNEIKYLVDFMLRNGVITPIEKEVHKAIQNDVVELVEEIQKRCNAISLKLDKEKLTQDLHFHLSHYFKLKKYDIQLEDNYVLSEVKNKYSKIFMIAKKSLTFFEEKLEIKMDETEISYVAIYIYKNLISLKKQALKVYIACATGKGLSNLLTTRIQNIFPQLEIKGQTSVYGLSKIESDIDFIISTVNLPNIKIPVVKVSIVLADEDIKRIQEFINLGSVMNKVPIQQTSFHESNKLDPFNLIDTKVGINRNELNEISNIMSKLTLTLLEYLSMISEFVHLNSSVVLGVVIHMNMAIPRWFANNNAEFDEEVEKGYERIIRNHNEIYLIMEKFFELVEKSLLITISRNERYAFYMYIISERERYDETID
ncbi:BglG family transcription antiterminator [Anaerorhabdus sp.]|uniref:BglG family transcription antiterminator n=1 Tax=Anaerorhabdus sp. TaxID=1872524 RepID=UPI002FC68BA9